MPLTTDQIQKINEEEEYRATVKNKMGSPVSQSKNKLVASLLSLFLGGLGLHKFYLGQTKRGLIYLLFCWTAIPSIIGFFEGIGLLIMSEEKFSKKYNK